MAIMQHVVFGTAGHIDHGKTTLVKALTGVDCDRLPEEQERGITIDLGFADLKDENIRLHFVDVPGHERLVHTMIAGAAGIDLALLVVAADEGVMPQTREHLDVIRLMGVVGGAVALTKIDNVDDDLAELAAEEIREYLEGTPFEGTPVVPVSAISGRGIEELRRVLVEQGLKAAPRQMKGRPYRQAVDRIFSKTGAGTVITGTSLWGTMNLGSDVIIAPKGIAARVRRLHVHGEERQTVEAGERVAINLAGVAREKISRGDQILSSGPWKSSRLVTVGLEILASAKHGLDEGDEVEVHALAARTAARVDRLSKRPLGAGQRGVAQLSLREPVLLFPGDRLVLRRPSPVNTFAGGQVLDAQLRRFRRRDAAGLEDLPSVQPAERPQLLEAWILRSGLAAMSTEELATRLGVTTSTLEVPLGRLLAANSIVALQTNPPRFVTVSCLEDLAKAAKSELARRLEGEEVSAGIPMRDFVSSLLPRDGLILANVYIEHLRQRGVIAIVDARVVPPGSDRHMTEAGAELTQNIEREYLEAGFDPPAPHNVAVTLQARPASVEGICRFLVQRGSLVRLDGKYLIHRSVLDEVVRKVRDWEVDTFGVGDFKSRFGLTRKLAIPVLEWLDSERVTVRAGSQRKILGKKNG